MKKNGLMGLIGPCLCGVLAVLIAGPSLATEWQRGPATPGDWFDPVNWTAGVPTSGTDAFIPNGGTAQIASGNAEASTLCMGFSDNTGHLELLGGALDVRLDMYLGWYGASTVGTTVVGDNAVLQVGNPDRHLYVGMQGYGLFQQVGGTVNAGGVLFIGLREGSEGHYELSAGQLSSLKTRIAFSGTGDMYQTGGTHSTGFLSLGDAGNRTSEPGEVGSEATPG